MDGFIISVTNMHVRHMMDIHYVDAIYLGLARTIYIRCIYGIFGREITEYTVIYGVYIRFWPTLYIRYFWQGNHQIYGDTRGIYTVLANPTYNTRSFTVSIYYRICNACVCFLQCAPAPFIHHTFEKPRLSSTTICG